MNLSRKWINPVLDKEFRLRMRTPRSAISLLAYILVLGLIALGFIYITLYLDNQGNQSFNSGAGRMMFYVLSFAQLVLIAFMAPALTAGVISGEREKQTLSMLLTTQQSSSTIILSKLFSSLSFMTLIIVATLPIYSIVFLYGGISLKQLIFIFLFYLFVMLLLGSLGVLFSTIFKRTMVSVIVTYGVGLCIFLLTGLLYLFVMSIVQRNYYSMPSTTGTTYSFVGYILGLNPAGALISLFEPSFSKSAFLLRNGNLNSDAPIQLWQEFVLVYSVVIIGALWISIRRIRPVARRKNNHSKSKNSSVETSVSDHS
ncbi:ABC transporter permease subunit [Paenibacillus sp. HJL G12]|uniref:ABC transporter permease subunit n=1 Tax=Paenibacillus dendrobii TaxID=2691084 RepID=A0A7X3II85_9BACL|nr:ABC transporter permease subunit [Paenibacillus dendrobii]MWV44394.1 ABC transporter permease subunit [Paenibacillus dendrobii]